MPAPSPRKATVGRTSALGSAAGPAGGGLSSARDTAAISASKATRPQVQVARPARARHVKLLIAFDTHHRGQDFVDGDLTGSVRVCRALGEEYGMLLEELFDVEGLERKVDVLRQYTSFQQLARAQRAHDHPQDISPDINDRPATRT